MGKGAFNLKRRSCRTLNVPWHHTVYSVHLDMSHHSVQLENGQKGTKAPWKSP